MSEGFIYVGYDATGYFKIGITNEPRKRIKQIRTGNPTFAFLWCFHHEKPQIKELEFHTKFSDKNINGEWFELAPDDLKYILKTFVRDGYAESFDYFDLWNRIVVKKAALDSEYMNTVLDYWNDFGREQK